MRILHTESSNGWGGQEMRILHEAMGMRERGHEIVIAVAKNGGLVEPAKRAGFRVYELKFTRANAAFLLLQLIRIIRKEGIELVNTHSSLDAWIGGIAARATGKKVIRTRHLSNYIRKGLNSRLLYNTLADYVIATSSRVIPTIASQARISLSRCKLIATGVDPKRFTPSPKQVASFRKSLGVDEGDCLVGTACVVRSWKGVDDLIRAAYLLRDIKQLKWVIIGGGYIQQRQKLVKELALGEILAFTGHLDDPSYAIQALDIFALLSTKNEGISQACLQAAYLRKPLVTTAVGGLGEVCKMGETGILVPTNSPKDVAASILSLYDDPETRKAMGQRGRQLVEKQFTIEHTLDQMEEIYRELQR